MPVNNNNDQFRKQLEKAVMEYKRLACPNLDCEDMIISKELILSPVESRIDYWCRNANCEYHQKASISRAIEPVPANTHSLIHSISQSRPLQLLSFFVCILVFWFVFTSYQPEAERSVQQSQKAKLIKQELPPKEATLKRE